MSTAIFFWGMSALLSDRAVPAPLLPLPYAFPRAGEDACHQPVIAGAYILRHPRF